MEAPTAEQQRERLARPPKRHVQSATTSLTSLIGDGGGSSSSDALEWEGQLLDGGLLMRVEWSRARHL